MVHSLEFIIKFPRLYYVETVHSSTEESASVKPPLLLCPNSLSSTQPLLSSTDPTAFPSDTNDDDDDDEYPDLLPVWLPPPLRPPRPPPLPLDHRPWLHYRRRPQPCRLPRLLLHLRCCLLFVHPPLLQPPLPLPFPLLFPLTIVSLPVPSPCPCSPATLHPEPTEEIPTSNRSTKVGGREEGRDQRRAVRITWEKLVRWFRSWRSGGQREGGGHRRGGRPWSALVPYCSQPREAPEICSLHP